MRDHGYWNSVMSETPGAEHHHIHGNRDILRGCYPHRNQEMMRNTVRRHIPSELLRYLQRKVETSRTVNPQRLEEEDERTFNLQRQHIFEGNYLIEDEPSVLEDFNLSHGEDAVPKNAILSESLHQQETATVTSRESPASIGVVNALEAVPSDHISMPTTATWNTVIRNILDSGCVDPETVDTIRRRHCGLVPNEPLHWNDSDSISMRQIKLVPNFSRPIAGAPFYDRFTAPETRFFTTSATLSPKPLTNGNLSKIPNGISTASISSSHTLSNRLATPDEVPVFLSSPTSPPLSPTTRIAQCESIISMQKKLIQSLHRDVDGLRECNENLEEIVIPKITQWLADKSGEVEKLHRKINRLLEQLADSKLCIDFGNVLLSRCWERERELWRWIGEQREKRKGKYGHSIKKLLGRKDKSTVSKRFNLPGEHESAIFGYDPDASISPNTVQRFRHNSEDCHSSSPITKDIRFEGLAIHGTALSRYTLGALVRFAEQNLAILAEDIAEMIKLVQNCK